MAVTAVTLAGTSCQDWGQADPPAAGQIYPALENVAEYTFNEEPDPMVFNLKSYENGEAPAIAEDEEKGQVLHLNNGYVEMTNPLTRVSVQNAVSMTFWMKQDVAVDSETGETLPQDLTGALFAFENANATGKLYFTANGWIRYSGADGEWSENDPASYKTGYITPGEWHYVALIIRNSGYALYVDGEKKTDKDVTDFDCSKLVKFMNNVNTLYIGYGGETPTQPWSVDDIKIYRNSITEKEIARPNLGGGNGGGDDVDLSKWLLVGNEDNSAGFWQEFSPYVNLTGDGTVHYEFYNYTNCSQNWCNWVLVLTNGVERGGDGYAEYVALRADAYGWGISYNGDALSHNYNFDTFKDEMNGAYVVMDITRKGTTVTMTSVTTTENGSVYNYSATFENVDAETMGTFFTLEGAHLLFNPDVTFVGTVYAPGENTLGPDDNTLGFWSAWTEMVKMTSPFKNFGYEFINHNSGAGSNWQNWGFVCTNGYQSGAGDAEYAEHYYLRADAYGWGASYEASTMTHGFDWDTFVSDMHNATCRVYFTYENSTLTLVARMNREDGSAIPEYRFVTPNLPLPIGLIFTGEGCWLEFTKIGYYPWADLTPQE